MRTVSDAGLDLIRQAEGLRLDAYEDSAGVLTIGYGHTGDVHPGQHITQDDADKLLQQDVQVAIDTIYAQCPPALIDDLPQPCFDSLTSFVFNCGAQCFENGDGTRTSFYAALTGPDKMAVATQMLRWTHAAGKVLPGLVKRRGMEAALWLSGCAVTATVPEVEHAQAENVLTTSSGVQPDVPPQTVAQTTTGKLQIGALVAGGTAAVIQGVQQAQPVMLAAQQVVQTTATLPQWLRLASAVLVGITIIAAALTLYHKHKDMNP